MGSQHLAELKRKAAEFERQLWDAHESLENQMAQSSVTPEDVTQARQEAFRWIPDNAVPEDADAPLPAGPVPVRSTAGPWQGDAEQAEPAHSPEDRTAGLVNHG